MRALASELGVEAMSLYRHVNGRAALLDGLAEQLMSEIEPRGASSDWTAGVRAFAASLRALAQAHPEAFRLVALQTLHAPAALQPIEDLLASLRSAGFTPARAIAAYRMIAAYTLGYALSESAGFALAETALAATLGGERYPTVRAFARQLASEPGRGSFEAGLDALIGGLTAERQQ